jgi:hypothetical protein
MDIYSACLNSLRARTSPLVQSGGAAIEGGIPECWLEADNATGGDRHGKTGELFSLILEMDGANKT